MLINQQDTERYLDWPALIDALRRQFRSGCEVPTRHHHTVALKDEHAATLLLMPAWQPGHRIGVKLVNVFPDNARRSLPSISADYLLYDGATGQRLAIMDGGVLTARRTAATAALGADFLAREDASTLFIVGAGRVGSLVPEAMRSIRPITRVLVCSPTAASAEKLCRSLRVQGFDAQVENDLEAGTHKSDIISCASLSHTPLIRGNWLSPGQHLDLIGSFTPQMRETDDAAMRIADVYVDADTTLIESGDLVLPIESGAFTANRVLGDLAELCRGDVAGRADAGAITLFKAVGTALADLAAGSLVYDSAKAQSPPQ